MEGAFQDEQLPTWATAYYEKWTAYEVEPGILANILCKDRNGSLLSSPYYPKSGINTVWDMFKSGLEISKNGKCLGWREGDAYKWWSYQEAYDRIKSLAGALSKQFKRHDIIGIYSGANPNWIISAMAAASRSLVIVPLYDTLGADSSNFVINQTEMSFVFADSIKSAQKIVANSTKTPSLRTIVMFTEPDNDLAEKCKENCINLTTLEKFTQDTREISAEEAFDEPKAKDLCAIFYTSGTTGDPKGVMHAHEAVVACVTIGWQEFFIKGKDIVVPSVSFRSEDISLHFLPFAHVYGYCLGLWVIYCGSALGFFGGNIMKLLDDALILKPTVFPLVPRLMNRIYCKIVAELNASTLKWAVFWFAYRRKRELYRSGVITRESIWDKLVFHKVQALLGGQVRFMCVGSAPISADVIEFFRVVFGVVFMDGYGQTETASAGFAAMGPDGGSVGYPLSCNYVKLVDVPECGYYVKDNRGEICLKGPNIMQGYYKMPEKTVEAIDLDGFLHTGDVGEFLPDRSMRIIDRRKHFFKLAQGEYIAPEKIEGVYLLSPEILQIFVDGNSLESYLVAIAYPEPTMAEKYARKNGIDPKTVHQDERYRKYILEALRDVGKANQLNSLEQIKSIYLYGEPFTYDKGILTPTMKNKRAELRKYFKEQIDALYKAGPIVGAAEK